MKKFSTFWGLVACVVLGSMFYDYSKSHKSDSKPLTSREAASDHKNFDLPAELRNKMEVLLTQSLIIKRTNDSRERNKLVEQQIKTLEESLALVRGETLTDESEDAQNAREVLKMERELKMLDAKVKQLENKMSRLQQAHKVDSISRSNELQTNNKQARLELSI